MVLLCFSVFAKCCVNTLLQKIRVTLKPHVRSRWRHNSSWKSLLIYIQQFVENKVTKQRPMETKTTTQKRLGCFWCAGRWCLCKTWIRASVRPWTVLVVLASGCTNREYPLGAQLDLGRANMKAREWHQCLRHEGSAYTLWLHEPLHLQMVRSFWEFHPGT